MNGRKKTALGVLLVIAAVVCLLLSLVVQLGESIRYQNAPAGSQITYAVRELVFILGLPVTAAASLI